MIMIDKASLRVDLRPVNVAISWSGVVAEQSSFDREIYNVTIEIIEQELLPLLAH